MAYDVNTVRGSAGDKVEDAVYALLGLAFLPVVLILALIDRFG